MGHKPPSPADQIRFLGRVQRLLAEGQFSATYKFALLHAIADLCVHKGTEGSGAPLTLDVAELTGCFVRLYQRQALPYPARDGAQVLKQSSGRQARVITVLRDPGEAYGTDDAAGEVPRKAISAINETIRDQPLWKLQTLSAGERLDFLYENLDEYAIKRIELRPGIAYCFRAFYDLIVAMARDGWEQWIRRHNIKMLDETTDLQTFLFGSERRDLSEYREILLDIQGRRCFYTGRGFTGGGAVDHFIPWSRYSFDLGHNFVLASTSANSQKSDHLACEKHLESWLDFCLSNRVVLDKSFQERSLPHSLETSLAIAEWSYAYVDRRKGQVWERAKEFGKLSGSWKRLIKDARKELSAA